MPSQRARKMKVIHKRRNDEDCREIGSKQSPLGPQPPCSRRHTFDVLTKDLDYNLFSNRNLTCKLRHLCFGQPAVLHCATHGIHFQTHRGLCRFKSLKPQSYAYKHTIVYTTMSTVELMYPRFRVPGSKHSDYKHLECEVCGSSPTRIEGVICGLRAETELAGSM